MDLILLLCWHGFYDVFIMVSMLSYEVQSRSESIELAAVSNG